MPVPFFDIHYNLDEASRRGLLARWARTLEHGGFVNGPEVRELEAALRAFLGLRHVLGCSNGSDALVLCLRALDVGPGDEVIVPAFTFFASAGAVARVGATPVFADVDPATYCLDPRAAAAQVTPRTKAVLPVHLYGRAAELPAIRAAVERAAGRRIALIEDAAQAIGAAHPAYVVGGYGEAAAWSCFPTKNLGAPGDAGFVSSEDEARAERMKRLREHGGGRQYHHDEVGYNFRMDSVQAAGLLHHLPRLLEFNAARRIGAEHYARLFREAGLSADAGGPITLPELTPGHAVHQYVVRLRERDALRAFLTERKIGCAVYYPLGLHLQPCFAHLGGKAGDLPHTERASAEVLALPIHPGVTRAQREEVIGAIAAYCAAAPRTASR
jgi:dTDP-4-amino-4,6-dideoxygalactose transaminase